MQQVAVCRQMCLQVYLCVQGWGQHSEPHTSCVRACGRACGRAGGAAQWIKVSADVISLLSFNLGVTLLLLYGVKVCPRRDLPLHLPLAPNPQSPQA